MGDGKGKVPSMEYNCLTQCTACGGTGESCKNCALWKLKASNLEKERDRLQDQMDNHNNNDNTACTFCDGPWRGEGRKCIICWGTGKKDGKHPNPMSNYKSGKWGLYDLDSEKEHLLNEIEKAERNAKDGKWPKDGPCLTKNGNKVKSVRKRYLVKNSKGQQVYLVKTLGGTDNTSYFPTDGDMREKHTKNTVGEFKKNDLWYTVYWRCQKSNHDKCRH